MGKLTKKQVFEKANWKNGKSAKWQVEEMAIWQKSNLTKLHFDKTASWQKVKSKLIKWQVDEKTRAS